MSDLASFATVGRSDPRSLALHLEVRRLQTELERLEARVGTLREHRSTATRGPADELETESGRADELVDRMVATLIESGRSEIADAADRRRRAAEDHLEADRRRATALVQSAQAEVERALAERGLALRAGWDTGLDVVALVDSVEAVTVAPVTPERAPIERVVVERVVVEPLVVEPWGGGTVEPTLPRAAEVEEARTDAAFEAWMAVAPAVIDPVGGEPGTTVSPAVPAVPIDTSPSDVAEPEVEADAPDRSRSRWLLPLEVVGALLVAAILVVLVLVFVG